MINGPSGIDDDLSQPVHCRHKGHQQHGELREGGQHGRRLLTIELRDLVHGSGRAHIGVQRLQQAGDRQNDQRHQIRIDPRPADHLLGFLFYLNAIGHESTSFLTPPAGRLYLFSRA